MSERKRGVTRPRCQPTVPTALITFAMVRETLAARFGTPSEDTSNGADEVEARDWATWWSETDNAHMTLRGDYGDVSVTVEVYLRDGTADMVSWEIGGPTWAPLPPEVPLAELGERAAAWLAERGVVMKEMER